MTLLEKFMDKMIRRHIKFVVENESFRFLMSFCELLGVLWVLFAL